MTLYDAMMNAADPSQVEGLSRFFKCGPGEYGEGDKFLGIKVPVTRSIVKSFWRGMDRDELERCISSEYHELRLAALLALVEIFSNAGQSSRRRSLGGRACHPGQGVCSSGQGVCSSGRGVCHSEQGVCHSEQGEESIRRSCIDFYLSHIDRINNWDLVDLSCYPLLGEWLLDKDRGLLYDLARSGRTLWEQRIGIVSTMTFIRHGQLSDTFAIADILLHHPHDLIHKAVGWLLRETGKRNQAALETFLQGSQGYRQTKPGEGFIPRYRQMPRTMLRYTIEKFPEPLRQQYLKGEL